MTDPTVGAADRNALRRQMRKARRSLSGDARREAEASIIRHIARLRHFRNAQRVGTFIAFDGEPDLAPLLCAGPATRFFVPVIDEDSMRFAAAPVGNDRRRNFFGIAEPREPRLISATTLDLVLTPLVAFDDRGVRIGVGRGYYDKCFEFLRWRRVWRRPKLLGVAFECQHVPAIEAGSWDVPLWGAVTERGIRIFTEASACATGS